MIKYYIAVAFLTAIVVGFLIYGFSKGGTPGKAREEKFDEKRVRDISDLKYGVESYYLKNGKLPSATSDIDKSLNPDTSTKDPENNIEYTYIAGEDNNYKLCANFGTSSEDTKNGAGYSYDPSLKHPKGSYCFDLKVQKQLQSDTSRYVYNRYLSSEASVDNPANKSKVAQTFRLTKDSDVKGIETELTFVNSYVQRVDGVPKLYLREFSGDSDFEAGKLLASADVLTGVLGNKQNRKILFGRPVKLSANKTYVLIFVGDGNTTMNLSYAQDENPDSSGNAYQYYSSNVPNSDPKKYVWNKYEKGDIYYKLIT